MQSRRQSLIETIVHIIAGFLTRFLVQVMLFPVLGIVLPAGENLAIAGVFTAVSLGRTYIIRRVFNFLHGKQK
jgi:hypothetical protein